MSGNGTDDYNTILSQVRARNEKRQEEWRRKAEKRRAAAATIYAAESTISMRTSSREKVEKERTASKNRARRPRRLQSGVFVSMPNDVLYCVSRFLWGSEMASASISCREMYKVLGETVVSEFVSQFGGRHPRRMVRTVLFRMVEKVRNRTMTNLKGVFLWASHHGYQAAVISAMSDERFDSTSKVRRPADGATALFLASQQNNLDIVKLLVAAGCDINLGTFTGYSPLHAACSAGHLRVVRFLIDEGADLGKLDKNGHTPIMLAAGQGRANVVRILAEAGCKVDFATAIKEDEGGETALHRACERGHTDMIRMLLEMNCDLECKTGQGRTPLIIASEEGHLEAVEILLEKGADARATTNAGKSALYNACERGFVSVAAALLKYGADPSQMTSRKKVPLYTAAEQGNVEMVKALLPYSKRADLFVETTYGTTPLFIATRSGNSKVKDLLVAFCNQGNKKKKAKVSASLAKAPSTPRFETDVDPIAIVKRNHKQAKEQQGRKTIIDKNGYRDFDAEAEARKQRLYGPNAQPNSSANAEEEEANAGGDEDFFNLSNPSGNPEHEAMVERARRRRAQKMEERKREEAELEQQAEERARRKEAARDRKWKKHKEKRLRQLEGRDKGVMDEDETDSSEMRRPASQEVESSAREGTTERTIEHPGSRRRVESFLKRQEEARREREAKVEKRREIERAKQAAKWVPGPDGVVGPPQPRADGDDVSYSAPSVPTAVGNGAAAVHALKSARGSEAGSPRVPSVEVKPKVVNIGF